MLYSTSCTFSPISGSHLFVQFLINFNETCNHTITNQLINQTRLAIDHVECDTVQSQYCSCGFHSLFLSMCKCSLVHGTISCNFENGFASQEWLRRWSAPTPSAWLLFKIMCYTTTNDCIVQSLISAQHP